MYWPSRPLGLLIGCCFVEGFGGSINWLELDRTIVSPTAMNHNQVIYALEERIAEYLRLIKGTVH